MARVTVEDCLSYVENAFELVLRASERARQLQLGEAEPLVPEDNDKPTVIALREIALGDEFIEALAKKKAEDAALERQGYEDYEEPVSLQQGGALDQTASKLGHHEVSDASEADVAEDSAAQQAIDAEAAADDLLSPTDKPEADTESNSSDVSDSEENNPEK